MPAACLPGCLAGYNSARDIFESCANAFLFSTKLLVNIVPSRITIECYDRGCSVSFVNPQCNLIPLVLEIHKITVNPKILKSFEGLTVSEA